jgi:hypothetical protein
MRHIGIYSSPEFNKWLRSLYMTGNPSKKLEILVHDRGLRQGMNGDGFTGQDENALLVKRETRKLAHRQLAPCVLS